MSNVNSEQVMSKIRAEISDDTVAPDELLDNGSLFHREIDVAEIMRTIKREAMFTGTVLDRAVCPVSTEDEIVRRLQDICDEVSRINNFIENTRVSAEENMHPGRVIPVRNSRPAIIRKIVTLIKRCVRKATHFLMLDQIAYNQKMDACVKALSESQEQVRKLADAVGVLAAAQKEQLASQEEGYRSALRETTAQYGLSLQELQKKMTTRYDLSLQELQKKTMAECDSVQQELLQKMIVQEEQFQKQIFNQELFIEQRKEEIICLEQKLQVSGDTLEQNIDAVSNEVKNLKDNMDSRFAHYDEKNVDMHCRIDALDRQSDAFSASVAKMILTYRQADQIVLGQQMQETSNSQPEAGEDTTYTRLDYFKFQNDFRGTRSTISERQKIYLPYFERRKEPVLDIGCGRGEFLRILKEQGVPAFGMDMYSEYVIEGKLHGLDIRQGDGIAFLKNTEMHFGGIFMAHVVEHISFADLQDVCFSAYEKLIPGSYLVFETPNPTCLSMFSAGFYIDPTHVKPVHPLLLTYVLREAGFREVQTIYTDTPAGDPLPLIDSDQIKNLEEVNSAITRVSNLLYGSLDYAVIAKK